MDVRFRPDLSTVGSAIMILMFVVPMLGCDKPLVGAIGKPVTAGGLEITVSDYDVRYLEINAGDNTYEYPRPVLSIPITLKNVGEGSFIYSPSHNSPQMTESATPLLYLDPGVEADLPPETKNLIPGVVLDKGSVDGQLSGATTLAKGDSASDILLFEVPDGAQKLVLSIPPAMNRGKMPVLFRIDYQPVQPKGPKVYKVGEAQTFDGVTFTVTGTSFEYVKTNDSAQGEGFSSDPLLKVSYEVTNGSDATIKLDPGHKAVGIRGAALYGSDSAYNRVKFAATTRVEGQVDGSASIDPGQTVKDFILFEAPPKDVSELSFEYPAALFERTGLARFDVPFEWKEVPRPKELEKK